MTSDPALRRRGPAERWLEALPLGNGRIGAMAAPIVIGVIVGMHLPLEQNFIAISIPAAIAAVTVGLIQHHRSDLQRQRESDARAVVGTLGDPAIARD